MTPPSKSGLGQPRHWRSPAPTSAYTPDGSVGDAVVVQGRGDGGNSIGGRWPGGGLGSSGEGEAGERPRRMGESDVRGVAVDTRGDTAPRGLIGLVSEPRPTPPPGVLGEFFLGVTGADAPRPQPPSGSCSISRHSPSSGSISRHANGSVERKGGSWVGETVQRTIRGPRRGWRRGQWRTSGWWRGWR